MAKAEFYEIVIKEKKEQIVLTNISLNAIISSYLKKNNDNENFCQNKTCAVILNSHYEKNENDMTFDFAKLTDQKVISTLISKPSEGEDTFYEYHNKILETTIYTDSEKRRVTEIISIKRKEDLVNELKSLDMDKFTIYKIILDNALLQHDELSMFENQIIKRLKKDSTYFNIIEKIDDSNHKLLIYQNSIDGLDIKYLETYLNTHLLINENFKVYFHKLYDADFMDLLQNGELKSFMFSYNIENKNNLMNDGLYSTFYMINDLFGNNITKVEVKPQNEDTLDNKKLVEFFEHATESGLLDSCELKTKGGGNKKINFKDKKLNIEYSERISIDSIDTAVVFFDRAFKNKNHIVKKRLGL
jgi:hypothetical protein